MVPRMGQFATYFYLIFHSRLQYSNIYSSQKKISCASGTLHPKDHSFSSIWWKSGQKDCIESFSIHQKISRTKNWAIFTYHHLSSHLKHFLHLNFTPSATFTLLSLHFRIRSKCISCQFLQHALLFYSTFLSFIISPIKWHAYLEFLLFWR